MNDQFPFHMFLNLNETTTPSSFFPDDPSTKKSAEKDLTPAIAEELKKTCPPTIFNSFFKDSVQSYQIKENQVVVTINSEFIYKIINTTYKQYLEEAINKTLGNDYTLSLTHVLGRDDKINTKPKTGHQNIPLPPMDLNSTKFTIDLIPSQDDLEKKVESTIINHFEPPKSGKISETKKTFNNFVVGPSNNMVYSTAISVCKNPGKLYSSFFIHSTSGNGKTHLLYAISNKIKELHPKLRTYITNTREFMNEMMDAFNNNSIFKFRKKYLETIDVLMFDDIHELKNRKGTQSEFLQILNELHGKGKQFIFTSSYTPNEIEGLDPKIKNCLSWGLILDIKPPDIETKVIILEKKATEEDIFIPKDVIVFLVNNIQGNIRDLEGALIRLGAYSSVMQVDIDLEMAKEHLISYNATKDNTSPDFIIDVVSNFFKIPIPDIVSQVRKKSIVHARHIAMYFCYKHLTKTFAEIGRCFNNRDHSTVLYSVEKIKKEIEKDPDFKNLLSDIEKMITSTPWAPKK